MNTSINWERKALRGIIGVVVAVNVTLLAVGCDRRAGDPLLTGPDPRMAATSAPGEINIFIHPGGEYRIGGEGASFRVERLSERLGSAYSRAPARERTLNVYAYKGVVGYDVVMAVNTARANGVTQVRAISNYGDSGLNRLQWKRWDLKLDPADAQVVAADTLRH